VACCVLMAVAQAPEQGSDMTAQEHHRGYYGGYPYRGYYGGYYPRYYGGYYGGYRGYPYYY
jgi:hypothetical protein